MKKHDKKFKTIDMNQTRNERYLDPSNIHIDPKLFHGRNFKITKDLCFVLITFNHQFLRISEEHIRPTLQKNSKK